LAKLAQEGVLFERAYTTTPLTIPAHSSLFTGQYPPTHGVRDNGDYFLHEDAVTLAERLSAVGYRTMASVGAEVTSHHWGFAQGFDAFFDDLSTDWAENRWRAERPASEVVDDALSWLHGDNSNAPWFAWLHVFDAHHPYAPPEPFATRFAGQPYLGEIASLDAQLGRVVSHLEASGALENTWVFVVADHGEGLGDHGESMHGALLYDSTTRIPFIVRPPRVGEARRVAFPVSLVDVAPTVLSVVGLPRVDAHVGVDLTPWLMDAAPTKDTPVRDLYLESLYAWRHFGWAPQRALVTETHKLIDSTTPEVYAETDTDEVVNMALDDRQVTRSLQAQMDKLAASLGTEGESTPTVGLSPEQVRQLEALGYLTAERSTGPVPFRGELADPVSHLMVLGEVEDARASLQADEIEAALTRLDALLTRYPDLHVIKPLAVQARLRAGDLDGALALAEAHHLDRPTSGASASLGYLFLLRGELDASAELFAQAVERDPYLENAWRGYLHVLFLKGASALFEQELARGFGYFPNSAFMVGMRGAFRVSTGDFWGGQSDLERALEQEPTQPFFHHALGVVRQQQARLDDAESLFLQEIQVHPPAVPSRRNLVKLYASQRRYTEQIEQLKVIMRIEPPNAMSEHSLAQVLFNLKRFDEANEAVASCRDLAPDYPACAMLEANILKKLGEDVAAGAAYERALQLKERIVDAGALDARPQ